MAENRPREPAWVSAQLSALPDPLLGSPRARSSTPSAVTGLRRALRAMALVGILAAAASAALVLRSRHVVPPEVDAAFASGLGLAFLASGLVAWERRPGNRVGPLLALVGFAWLAFTLAASNHSLSFTFGVLAGGAWTAALAHFLLAFPDGHLATPGRRVLVGAGYAFAALRALLLAADPDRYACRRCPDLLFEPSAGGPLLEVLWLIGLAGPGAVGLLAAGVLVRRMIGMASAQRRGLDAVLAPGIAALALLAVPPLVAGAPGNALDWGPATWPARTAALLVPIGFALGAVRTRLHGATAVADLVARLSDGSRSGRVDLALARALGDSTLSLAYWLPADGRYVDADGRPVDLPDPGSDRVATEVERDGRPVAAIVHAAWLSEDPELVRAAGAAAALALENERLEASLRARVEELRDSRARMVRATDAERRRLERNLHDGAQQRLVAASLQMRLAMGKLTDDPEAAGRLLTDTFEELQVAMDELRELARGIHPAILTDRGLAPALSTLAARAAVPVEVASEIEGRLEPPVEAAAYYVVAEALTNVAKYAEATHASVRVERHDGKVVVEVADDGVGGADPSAGSGLRGLWDRVGALDGRIEVSSSRGTGTRIRAEIPARSGDEAARPPSGDHLRPAAPQDRR